MSSGSIPSIVAASGPTTGCDDKSSSSATANRPKPESLPGSLAPLPAPAPPPASPPPPVPPPLAFGGEGACSDTLTFAGVPGLNRLIVPLTIRGGVLALKRKLYSVPHRSALALTFSPNVWVFHATLSMYRVAVQSVPSYGSPE